MRKARDGARASDADFVEAMRGDDEELLRFAFLWLRFSLFGEPTMRIKGEVLEAFKGRLEMLGGAARKDLIRAILTQEDAL